jgi:hypothetical protein
MAVGQAEFEMNDLRTHILLRLTPTPVQQWTFIRTEDYGSQESYAATHLPRPTLASWLAAVISFLS